MWLVCENPAARALYERDLVTEEVLDEESNEVEVRTLVGMDAPLDIGEDGRCLVTADVGNALCDKYPGAFRKAKNKDDVSAAYKARAEAGGEAPAGEGDDDNEGPATGPDNAPDEGEGE